MAAGKRRRTAGNARKEQHRRRSSETKVLYGRNGCHHQLIADASSWAATAWPRRLGCNHRCQAVRLQAPAPDQEELLRKHQDAL